MTKNVPCPLLIHLIHPPAVNSPARCRFTRPLSIHLPLVDTYTRRVVDMPTSCRYARPVVNTLAFCQYAHSVVDMPALLSICLPCCRYARCVVDTPAMLSIRPPCCRYARLLLICLPCGRYTHLLSIHLRPYRYTCGPIDMPALAVIVVGRGAADDVAGSMDAHIPRGGEGQGMPSRW